MRKIGIDFITAFAMSPPDLVRLAGELGCGSISCSLQALPYNPDGFAPWALKNAAVRRETAAALRDTGVALGLGEGFAVGSNLFGQAVAPKDLAEDMDIMAELGAQRINTISFDADLPRVFDQFAEVVEMAAQRGLPVVTEFAPCFGVADLPAALKAVRHVGRPDFRVLLDTMHLARSGGTAADVAALDPDLIGYCQFCDVPAQPAMENYLEEAMFERLPPGEGDADLVEVVRALPSDVIISVEVPQRAKAEAGVGPKARIGHIVEAARRVVAEAGA